MVNQTPKQAFRLWYRAARTALRDFRHMRDAGPFLGVYLRRGHMWDYQNGLQRGDSPVGCYYEMANEIRKATGHKYRRAEIASMRAVRTFNRVKDRLP